MRLFFTFLLFLSLWAFQISGQQTTFQINFNYDGFDVIGGVKSISTGYVAAGWAYGSVNFSPVGIGVETDTLGNIVWAKRYVGPGFIITDPMTINDMQKLSAGGYIVTGGVGSYAMLMKLSATGSTVWASGGGRRYRISNEWGNGVKETSAGDLVIAGGSSAKSMNPNKDSTSIYVFKTNSSGTYQWGRSYTLTSPVFDSHDAANDVVELSDGYAFTGYHSEQNGADTTTNILLFKTDFSGTLQWMKSYGELGKNESGYSLQLLSSNELLIVGYTDKTTSLGDVALIKTDLSGNITFSASYNVGLLGVQPGSLLKTSDGGYAISGWVITNVFPLTVKSFLLKLNSSFGVQFTKQYSGLVGSFFTESDIANDGGYIIGTLSGGQTSWDAHLIKTDVNGASGCNENNFTTLQQVYSPPAKTITPTVHTGGSGSNFTPAVSTISPTKNTVCLFSNCAKPNASITPSSATICSGSSATLTASGGGTYLWSTGATTSSITVSTGGTYTVTVTVSGCDSVPSLATVTVNSTPAPTITAGGPTTFCQSGSVMLTSSAANSYSWSNGATSQSITVSTSGSYTVTVTGANTCTAVSSTTTVTVNANPATPTITPGGPTTFCTGGSVTLTSSAENLYVWSTGATSPSIVVTASGNYTVTVTNTGNCTAASGTTIVTVNTSPTVSITASGPTTFCQGDSVLLTSAAASSYLWSNGATSQSITVTSSGSFTVTITAANGCTAVSSPQSVTANSAPSATVTATGDTTFCVGDSVLLTAAAAATYLWSNGATSQSIKVDSSGSYSVTVTNAGNCSAVSSPVVVTVKPKPAPAISGANSACANTNGVVYSVSNIANHTYNWMVGGATLSSGQGTNSIIINFGAPGNVTLTIVETDTSIGCSDSAVKVVVVNANLNPSIISSGDTTFCMGQSDTLNAGSGYSTYIWSNGDTAQKIIVTTSGNYFVTVSDANGCTGSSSSPVTITVYDTPTPFIAFNGDTTLCTGDSAVLTANPAAAAYQWNNGDTTQSIVVKATGTYSVIVTDTNGCSDTSVSFINISVYQNPVVVISTNDSTKFCQGDSVELTATAAASYLWSTGATSQKITVTASGNYSVLVTDTNGCSNDSLSATIAITVDSLPVTAISGNDSICSGDSTTLTATGGNKFLWNTLDTTSSIVKNPAATTTYIVLVTDTNGCSNIDSVLVNVTTISVTISGNNTLCEGDSVTLNASANPPGSAYFWSNGSTASSLIIAPPNDTTVWITATSSINNNCKAYDTMKLFVIPKPNASAIASPDSVCFGQTSTLTGIGGGSYLWNDLETAPTIFVSPLLTTTYFLTVTVNGCSDNDSVKVTVSPLPQLAVSANDSSICKGDTAILSAAVFSGTFKWSNDSTTSPLTVTPVVTTTYLITATLGSCTKTDSITIAVSTPPAAMVTLSDSVLCFGEMAQLIASGGTSYLWSTGETKDTITVSPGIDSSYTVTVFNGACATDTTAKIYVFQMPFADAGKDTTINLFDKANLVGTGNGTYLWSPDSTITCTGCLTTTAFPQVNATYYFKVTDINGCVSIDSVKVNVVIPESDVFIPNIFSPNGDGKNDIFYVYGRYIADMQIDIYDRWGELVFTSQNKSQGWDGTFRGDAMNSAVFVYIFKGRLMNGKQVERKGNFALMR